MPLPYFPQILVVGKQTCPKILIGDDAARHLPKILRRFAVKLFDPEQTAVLIAKQKSAIRFPVSAVFRRFAVFGENPLVFSEMFRQIFRLKFRQKCLF